MEEKRGLETGAAMCVWGLETVYCMLHVYVHVYTCIHVCVHVISQHGGRCLGGLITPAYSLMLRLSTPVYQGRDAICLV